MRSHPMVATTRPRRIAVAATIFVVVGTLLALGVATLSRMSSGPGTRPGGSSEATQLRSNARAIEPQVSPERDAAVADEVDRLRNSQTVPPRISNGRSRIAGEASLQPDLYATAFVKELLTQNYLAPRGDVLSWVQAESALTNEQRIVGLTPPELRSKWAVFSVSDGPTPMVPTIADWSSLSLRRGRTTVELQRVIEPVAWSTAVAAGEISDPGVTAREVTALVTLHTTEAGINKKIVTSAALTLNLEGPPALPSWAFVGAVTYDAVLVSRS